MLSCEVSYKACAEFGCISIHPPFWSGKFLSKEMFTTCEEAHAIEQRLQKERGRISIPQSEYDEYLMLKSKYGP